MGHAHHIPWTTGRPVFAFLVCKDISIKWIPTLYNPAEPLSRPHTFPKLTARGRAAGIKGYSSPGFTCEGNGQETTFVPHPKTCCKVSVVALASSLTLSMQATLSRTPAMWPAPPAWNASSVPLPL